MEKHITALMLQISVGAQDDLRGAVKERLRGKANEIGGGGGGDGSNDPPGGGLGDGVLERNLGVPMVVVGCKADSLQSETFEQQQRLHFIQQSLRRFCLKCEIGRGGGGSLGRVGSERGSGGREGGVGFARNDRVASTADGFVCGGRALMTARGGGRKTPFCRHLVVGLCWRYPVRDYADFVVRATQYVCWGVVTVARFTTVLKAQRWYMRRDSVWCDGCCVSVNLCFHCPAATCSCSYMSCLTI